MMRLAARRTLGPLAQAGVPYTPGGLTLAIDDGFSGSGVLHGTSPDTVGSPATWAVLDNVGSATDGLIRSGGSAALASIGLIGEGWIDHGTDVIEIAATVNLGPGATGSNVRRAGVVLAVDPARATSTHVLRGEYTVWLRYEPTFKALHLIYSPGLSTAASLVASYSITPAASTDYAIKVEVDGSTLRVYLDGIERITYDATGTLANLRYAGISLSAASGAGVPTVDRYQGWTA